MSDEVERLAVLIEANIKSYERAMARLEQKTTGALAKSSRSVKSLDTQLKGLALTGRTVMQALGAGALVGGLASLPALIRETVGELAAIADVADKVGLTTERLQELHFAAEQNGSSAADMSAAMEQFSRRLGEAAQGGGELFRILQANGIEIRNVDGSMRPLNDLLADYADLIKNAGSDQDRLVLATEAFGRAGDDMANVLRNGSAGLNDAAREAHALKVILGDDLVQAGRDVDDEFAALQSRFDTLVKSEIVRVIDDVKGAAADLAAVGDAAAAAWGRFVEIWNQVAGISAEDAAKAQLKAGLLQGAVTGDFGTAGVTDWITFPEAPKGDRADAAPAPTTVLPPSKSSSGSSGRTPEEEFAREIANIQKRTDAIALEAATIGMSTYEAEKAKMAFDLWQAAIDAGVAITPQLTAEIDRTAEAYARQTAQLEETRDAQERLNEQAQFFGDMAYDGLSSVLVHGEDAIDVVKRLGQALLDAALQAAILGDGPFGSGGRGIVGAIGAAFGLGRATGGPAQPDVAIPVGERGPELFIPKTRGTIVSNSELGRMGRGGGLSMVNHFDLRNADPSMKPWIEGQLARVEASIVPKVQKAIRQGVMR